MLLAVGMASFFAGTFYTIQLGINKCPSDNSNHKGLLAPKIEALTAQKRVRGDSLNGYTVFCPFDLYKLLTFRSLSPYGFLRHRTTEFSSDAVDLNLRT